VKKPLPIVLRLAAAPRLSHRPGGAGVTVSEATAQMFDPYDPDRQEIGARRLRRFIVLQGYLYVEAA
jgi:hypothetical protein